MLRARILAGVLVLGVFAPVAACSTPAGAPDGYPVRVRFGSAGNGPVLWVRIAASDAEKQRGLMGVETLPDDAGMAFVWDAPTESGFWMKDTLLPLAIAFVDDHQRIESIREMTPCTADPCPLYRSDGPFVLAIEASAGWFDRHHVAVGDHVGLELSS